MLGRVVLQQFRRDYLRPIGKQFICAPPCQSAPAEALSKASTTAPVCQGNDAHLGCRPLIEVDDPAFQPDRGRRSTMTPAC
jgi:hypothetical protein